MRNFKDNSNLLVIKVVVIKTSLTIINKYLSNKKI